MLSLNAQENSFSSYMRAHILGVPIQKSKKTQMINPINLTIERGRKVIARKK
jgi:hypothetical protein